MLGLTVLCFTGMVLVWLDSRAPEFPQHDAPIWGLHDDGADGLKVLPIDDLEYFGQTDDVIHTHIQVIASCIFLNRVL